MTKFPTCLTCHFFDTATEECRESPLFVIKSNTDWCGKHPDFSAYIQYLKECETAEKSAEPEPIDEAARKAMNHDKAWPCETQRKPKGGEWEADYTGGVSRDTAESFAIQRAKPGESWRVVSRHTGEVLVEGVKPEPAPAPGPKVLTGDSRRGCKYSVEVRLGSDWETSGDYPGIYGFMEVDAVRKSIESRGFGHFYRFVEVINNDN